MTAAGSSFLRGWKRSMYSRVQNSIERLFWAGNQGNHQNFEKKLYLIWNPRLFSLKNQNFFFEKKSKIHEISWIGPLVSRIDHVGKQSSNVKLVLKTSLWQIIVKYYLTSQKYLVLIRCELRSHILHNCFRKCCPIAQ